MDFKTLTSLLAAIFITSTAHAAKSSAAFQPLLSGVDSSGGGNAVVCRNTKGRIKSAEVLDLFEARVLYGLTIPKTAETSVDLAERHIGFAGHLNPLYFMELERDFQRVVKNAKVLPPDIGLRPIDDSFSPALPKNCAIEQLAAYQINNELYIDGEIWQALDETNRAALYIHESIYKAMRSFGAKNSVRSRKITGYLLSGFPFKPAFDSGLQKPDDKLCTAGDAPFWAADAAIFVHFHDDLVTIYFVGLSGQPVVSEKTLTLKAEVFNRPDPGATHLFMDPPITNFESGEQIALTFDHDGIYLRVQSAFGDDSLNGNYHFTGCQNTAP